MFLLDSNVVSDLVRRPRGRAWQHIVEARDRPVATSVIVAAEIRFGIEKRGSAGLAQQVEAVLQALPVLPLGTEVAAIYGHVRATLERRGVPIGANDLFIAAHALALDATLVTDNVREFARVDGLAVVNWLRD